MNIMFTPTKEELEELGFKKNKNRSYIDYDIMYYEFSWGDEIQYSDTFYISVDCSCCTVSINIKSLDDLKTLIRLLTP